MGGVIFHHGSHYQGTGPKATGRSSIPTLFVSLSGPLDGDDRALRGWFGVGELDRAAGPLDEDSGDEKTQTMNAARALVTARTFALREVGLADSRQDVGRKALSVVGNDDPDRRLCPARADNDRLFGESDRVFDQIAKRRENAGVVRAFGRGIRPLTLDGDR